MANDEAEGAVELRSPQTHGMLSHRGRNEAARAVFRCLAGGAGVTPQSHAVLLFLADAACAEREVTATEVWASVNRQERLVSISTVHRILRHLRGIGVVDRITKADGRFVHRLSAVDRGGEDTVIDGAAS